MDHCWKSRQWSQRIICLCRRRCRSHRQLEATAGIVWRHLGAWLLVRLMLVPTSASQSCRLWYRGRSRGNGGHGRERGAGECANSYEYTDLFARVRPRRRWRWADAHYRVTGATAAELQLAVPPVPTDRTQAVCSGDCPPAAGGSYYVYNVLAELDSPGEVYLDRSKGMLYIWPPNTTTMVSADGGSGNGNAAASGVMVSISSEILRVTNASDITWQDIDFRHSRGMCGRLRRMRRKGMAGTQLTRRVCMYRLLPPVPHRGRRRHQGLLPRTSACSFLACPMIGACGEHTLLIWFSWCYWSGGQVLRRPFHRSLADALPRNHHHHQATLPSTHLQSNCSCSHPVSFQLLLVVSPWRAGAAHWRLH